MSLFGLFNDYLECRLSENCSNSTAGATHGATDKARTGQEVSSRMRTSVESGGEGG